MSLNIVPLGRQSPRPSSPIPEALPSISIITPSLNRADWIETAIRSVLDQGYSRVQHIIADGGSSDGTLARLQAYPHLTLVPGPDRNSHHAMNKGLKVATGEIVGFLNTDDYYPPGALQAVGARFAADPDLRVLRGGCLLAEAGRSPDMELRHDDEDLWGELLFGAPGFNSWFFRRDWLVEMGGVDDGYVICADRDLLIRMALQKLRPATLGQTIYVYQRHAGSATLDQDARLAVAMLSEHVDMALSLRRLADAWERQRLDAFLAFELWQLAMRLLRGRQWMRLGRLLLQIGLWLPRWPHALWRARKWRGQLQARMQ